MDWSKGYSSATYLAVIDPVTWREIDRIEILDGSITKKDSDLMESASATCRDAYQNKEQWVRFVMDVRQNGSSAHVALFTGLATSPDRTINGKFKTDEVECYSVLKPADDIMLPTGYYAPVGFPVPDLVEQLLETIPAPIVKSTKTVSLSSSIVAERKETNLSMAQKVLKAVNWHLRIEGDGTVNIEPVSRKVVAEFNSIDADCIEKVVKMSYDWYSCPNVFRATQGNVSAVARDTDPDSLFSTRSRKREIWMADDNCKLGDGESVAEYAARRLEEEQAAVYKMEYTRRFHPDVLIGDRVRINYPDYDMTGIFKVVKQSIDLGFGARTKEEVHGVELW